MKNVFLRILLAFSFLMAVNVNAAVINLGDPIAVSQASDRWYVDRYGPNGWSYNGGSGVLKQTISADDRAGARPPAFASAFYNTQGRKHDFGPSTTMMSIELYIPGDLLQQRYAGFWGTGVDGSNQITGYPIIEFAADGTGPRFQGWDDANGWVDYGLPGTFGYDMWHELKISLDQSNDQWDYYVNGGLLGSVDAFGATGLSNVILQGYNYFRSSQGSYDIRWRNLVTDTPDNRVPEPGSFALVAIAFFGLAMIHRKKQHVALTQ